MFAIVTTWFFGSLILGSAALLLVGEGLNLLQRRSRMQLVPARARREHR
jgi:hypothetical protein